MIVEAKRHNMGFYIPIIGELEKIAHDRVRLQIEIIDEFEQAAGLGTQKDAQKTDHKKGLDLTKFSFLQSIEATKDFQCSFSDAVIEERRAYL